MTVERFVAALTRVGGRPIVAPSRDEAVAEVVRICADRPVALDNHPDLAGVAERLRLVADPWDAEVGVTGAVAGVCDTGSLALVADWSRPRSTSLVPPVHVALLPSSRLVDRYADAVGRLAAIRPIPSAMWFITGPSRSADIELTLVTGMHGPGEVHVVLYEE
jgi:L-lactate dehydrogenase complex protein LldG